MPANVRIRCHYIDCKFLDDLFCGNPNIEIAPKGGCQMYVPVESPEEIEEEEEPEDEEEELEEDWIADEEEEDDDFDSGELEE